jgi:hypothetical protein
VCAPLRHGPHPQHDWAGKPKPHASTMRPGFSIFIYYSINLNKLQKSIKNTIRLKKYEINF